MAVHELHLHSMVVHSVVALAVVGAASCVMAATGSTVGPIGPSTWPLLCWGSLAILWAATLPAALTGIAERNRMYATWHRSHKAKLWLSLLLLVVVGGELVAAAATGLPDDVVSPLGLAIVAGNPVLGLALAFYGLRITLGRQSLVGTSYVPDMHREPAVDVLEEAARHVAEPARVFDILEEPVQ